MQDGLVDRYFNRRLSGHLTRWFLKTSLTPNQITLLSFTVGLIAGLFFWKGGYINGIAGALIFQFSAVLDCCDGEVARLKGMQSRLGQWLDMVCDNIVHVVLFLAIAGTIYRVTATSSYLVLGGLASIGSLFSLCVVLLLDSRSLDRSFEEPRPDRRGFFDASGEKSDLIRSLTPPSQAGTALAVGVHSKHLLLRKAMDRLTNRDFSAILLLFTLLGKLDWFLWLAALGSNIFWMVLLWIYWKEERSFS